MDEAAFEEARHNQTGIAKRGRDPGFRLIRDGRKVPLRAWASEMLEKVARIAALIDRSEGGDSYLQAVYHMGELVDEPDATPSARLLAELRNQGMSFFDYAYSTARKHRDYFEAITPMPAERYSEFEAEALRSIERQHEIEANDRISFEQYLANYFDQ